MIMAENFQAKFEDIMHHYTSPMLHEWKQKISGVFPIIFEYQKCQIWRSVMRKGVGLSRAPSAVQLMREDVLELVGHKPWEEGS